MSAHQPLPVPVRTQTLRELGRDELKTSTSATRPRPSIACLTR
jgi:hypothetical protein